MKPVLFIAYQFPPRGGPGVHRSINFSKNLLDFGYRPVVITTTEETIITEGVTLDKSLMNEVNSVEIIRIENEKWIRGIKFLFKIKLFRIVWTLFYPLFFEWSVIWSLKAYRAAKQQIQKHDIKIVYTSSSPFSSWIVGYLLKRNCNIKWVADIRDPFTDGYMWRFPTKLHWFCAKRYERKMLRYADKVIVNTPEVEKLYLSRKLVDKNKLMYLTNGF